MKRTARQLSPLDTHIPSPRAYNAASVKEHVETVSDGSRPGFLPPTRETSVGVPGSRLLPGQLITRTGGLGEAVQQSKTRPPHFNIIPSFPKEHLAPISRNRPSSCPPLTRLLFPNSQSRFPLDTLRTRIIASKTRNGTTLLLLGCFCSKTEMESKTCQNGFLGFLKN